MNLSLFITHRLVMDGTLTLIRSLQEPKTPDLPVPSSEPLLTTRTELFFFTHII